MCCLNTESTWQETGSRHAVTDMKISRRGSGMGTVAPGSLMDLEYFKYYPKDSYLLFISL